MGDVQLIYASQLNGELSLKDIREIVEKANVNNAKLGVTGLLIYRSGYFLQVLEGSQECVNALYLKIAGDSRHEDIRILNFSKIINRNYPNWNMKALIIETQVELNSLLNKYFTDGFVPYDLTPEQAGFFMTEVSNIYKED